MWRCGQDNCYICIYLTKKKKWCKYFSHLSFCSYFRPATQNRNMWSQLPTQNKNQAIILLLKVRHCIILEHFIFPVKHSFCLINRMHQVLEITLERKPHPAASSASSVLANVFSPCLRHRTISWMVWKRQILRRIFLLMFKCSAYHALSNGFMCS